MRGLACGFSFGFNVMGYTSTCITFPQKHYESQAALTPLMVYVERRELVGLDLDRATNFSILTREIGFYNYFGAQAWVRSARILTGVLGWKSG